MIIFSVDTGHGDLVNEQCRIEVEDVMKELEIPFTICEGCYKGITEVSYCVPNEYENDVKSFCKDFEQECYLIVLDSLRCFLVYPDKSEYIGKWTKTVSDSTDYTKIGDEYYVCV